MKKKTLFLIVSILLMLTMTACGRKCTCNCNCSSGIVDNSEIEAIPETTLDSTPEHTPYSEEIELEEEEEIEDAFNEKEKEDKLIKKEKEKTYNEAKELYWSGKWDGKPMTIRSRTVSIDAYGAICIDGESINNNRRVDLPDNISRDDVDSNLEYISGEGVFAFQDTTLIKYVRGEKIELGTFKYKGLNPQHPEEYGCQIINGRYYPPDYDKDGPNGDNSMRLEWPGPKPMLYFDKESKKLLFITENPLEGVNYLYVFTDYNKAEAKYIGEIDSMYCISNCFPDGKAHLSYCDMEGNGWIWCENGPVLYEEFEKKYKK